MLYFPLDMAHNRFNCYFWSWAIVCPFAPLTARKINILEKWKNSWRYYYFKQVYQKLWSYSITILEIWCVTDVIVNFHFGLFFCLFTLVTAQKNQNFKKMKKTPGDIIILHMCTKKYDEIKYSSWDMVRDRWTADRWIEKVTYRGGCPT